MKKSQFGKFIWNALPVFAIIVIASVLVTWQITYNYVSKTMAEKYDETISKVTSTNDISTMIYNVDSVIRAEYLGTVDEKKLVDGTISGYIYGLGDKYASYMTEEQYNKYITDNLEGEKFTGIGITCVFDTEAGGLYLVSIYDDTPAYRVGLSHGEVITKIDGSAVTDIGYDAAIELIASKSIGDIVNITVRSIEGTERNVPVPIEQITIDTVTYRMLNGDTGLIKISEFSGTTPDEFKSAIANLTNSGADRFVFDVRNNPGGNLDSIVKVLDFILPAGNIITINNKNGTQSSEVSDELEFTAPMAVIVNANTASAAELFTAALRDYDKAEIVGNTTYGKGTVQQIIKLPNGGAASVSVSTYIPPCGVSYDGIGIVPDHEVSLTEAQMANFLRLSDEEDAQLQKALDLVSAMEVENFE